MEKTVSIINNMSSMEISDNVISYLVIIDSTE